MDEIKRAFLEMGENIKTILRGGNEMPETTYSTNMPRWGALFNCSDIRREALNVIQSEVSNLYGWAGETGTENENQRLLTLGAIYGVVQLVTALESQEEKINE